MRRLWKWSRRLALAAACVLALLWLAQMFLLPGLIHRQIVARLEAQGLSPVNLTVDHVSLGSATIRDLSAGDALSARVVHVTYTPGSLLSGRVAEIAIQGARVRPEAWPTSPPSTAQVPSTQLATAPTTQPATSTTKPPFSRLTATNVAVEIPTATGPTTVPVDLLANETADRKIHTTIKASYGSVDLSADLISHPDFHQHDGTISLTADTAELLALTGQNRLTADGKLSIEARANISTMPTTQWHITDLMAKVNAPHLAVPGTNFSAENAAVTIHGSAKGAGRNLSFDLFPDSAINAQLVQVSPKIPPFAASVLMRPTSLAYVGNDWTLTTDGAELTAGDLALGFREGQLQLHQGRVTGRIASAIDLGVAGRSQLMQGIVPALKAMQLGGSARVVFSRAIEQGQEHPSLAIRIRNGTIASQEYALEAAGIEADLVILDPANPHSPPGQKLTMDYGRMGKWEVRDTLFEFALKDLGTLDVQKTQIGWLGGQIWCDPYQVQFASPLIRSRVYGKDLDLGKLIWVVSNEKAWAEGQVDLDVPVSFLWPRMRFGDGYVEAHPGGVLHLTYVSDQLGKYLAATDPRFTTDETYARIRQNLVDALMNFRFDKLRAGFSRTERHLLTKLEIQGRGMEAAQQAVNLNVTVDDLDWLISRYLALKKD